MIRQLACILMCAAMFAVIGGHRAVVQAVAWAEMIRDYSEEEGCLMAGLKRTFSGNSPCDMCRMVAKARNVDQKQSAALHPENKVGDFLWPKPEFSSQTAWTLFTYPRYPSLSCLQRNDPPPSPVPIEALGPVSSRRGVPGILPVLVIPGMY